MQEEEKKQRYRTLFLIIIVAIAAVVALVLLVKSGLQIPCIFNKLTGLYCPGCGNTRAAMAVLKLDFVLAFKFNPMFFAEIIFIVRVFVVCATNYIKKGRFSYHTKTQIIDIVFLSAIVLWGIVRNILPIL